MLNALFADTSLFDAELSLAQTRRNELCRWSNYTKHLAVVGNNDAAHSTEAYLLNP
jgi:hypothetical protein